MVVAFGEFVAGLSLAGPFSFSMFKIYAFRLWGLRARDTSAIGCDCLVTDKQTVKKQDRDRHRERERERERDFTPPPTTPNPNIMYLEEIFSNKTRKTNHAPCPTKRVDPFCPMTLPSEPETHLSCGASPCKLICVKAVWGDSDE
jgi:hypothetical protein